MESTTMIFLYLTCFMSLNWVSGSNFLHILNAYDKDAVAELDSR